jgi:hypothetical protein
MESRRLVGRWWLPAAADRKVGGILEVGDHRAPHLELTDSLLSESLMVAPIIHGAADGRQVTLLDCSQANGGKMVIAQTMTSTQMLRASVALVGIHLDSSGDEVFDGFEVSMSGLTAWAGTTGFDRTFTFSQETNERSKFLVNYVDPVRVKIPESTEHLELRWNIVTNGPQTSEMQRTYRADETVMLAIQSQRPKAWNGYLKRVREVRDLITISMQRPAHVGSRTLLINQEEPLPPYRIDTYFQGLSAADDDVKRDFRGNDLIFTLSDVDLYETLAKWLSLRKRLGLPLDVLLGLDYQSGGYYENRIFNAASAAEGFHAPLCPETTGLTEVEHTLVTRKIVLAIKGIGANNRRWVLDRIDLPDRAVSRRKWFRRRPRVEAPADLTPDEYEKLCADTADSLGGLDDPKLRQWVRNRTGDNRPGLKERYLELATKADSAAVQALLTDVDLWAKWLRNARNAIGHLNTDELQAKVPEDARYRLTYVTRALLHLVILNELGVSPEVQRRLVSEEWSYAAATFANAMNQS